MSLKNVKEHISKLCQKHGTDFSMFLVSCGEKFTRPKLRMSIQNSVNRHIHRYAVKYYESCKTYIMWDLSTNKGYILSISTKDIESAIRNHETTVKKPVQYSGWGYEIVSVYNENELENFIKSKSKSNS